MTTKASPQELRELVRAFEALRGLHEQLYSALEEKIGAMRRADIATLHTAGEEEQVLLQQLRERGIRRASLMQSVARECGMTPRAARSASVSQIAELLPGAERGLLLDASGRLQATIAKTAQANRIAASIAREVMGHMKFVFSAVRPVRTAPVGYTRRGESFVAGAAVMDVVG